MARAVSGFIILRKVFGRASGLNRFHRFALPLFRALASAAAAASANRTQAMTSSTIERRTSFLERTFLDDMGIPPLREDQGQRRPDSSVLN